MISSKTRDRIIHSLHNDEFLDEILLFDLTAGVYFICFKLILFIFNTYEVSLLIHVIN